VDLFWDLVDQRPFQSFGYTAPRLTCLGHLLHFVQHLLVENAANCGMLRTMQSFLLICTAATFFSDIACFASSSGSRSLRGTDPCSETKRALVHTRLNHSVPHTAVLGKWCYYAAVSGWKLTIFKRERQLYFLKTQTGVDVVWRLISSNNCSDLLRSLLDFLKKALRSFA